MYTELPSKHRRLQKKTLIIIYKTNLSSINILSYKHILKAFNSVCKAEAMLVNWKRVARSLWVRAEAQFQFTGVLGTNKSVPSFSRLS